MNSLTGSWPSESRWQTARGAGDYKVPASDLCFPTMGASALAAASCPPCYLARRDGEPIRGPSGFADCKVADLRSWLTCWLTSACIGVYQGSLGGRGRGQNRRPKHCKALGGRPILDS